MRKARSLTFRPWLIVTLLCLLYVAGILVVNEGNSLSLVTIGTRFSEGDPAGSEGYDGQFVYYIARDPTRAAQFLDVPAYRFQRIMLPVLGILFSVGQVSLIPWALLFTNLVAIGVGTWLLEKLLTLHGASRWYAVIYGLSIGILGSVRLTLSEPLAYGMVIAGVTFAQQERWGISGIVFALAALTKETTLFFVAGYVLYLLVQQRLSQAIFFGAVATIPFIVWQTMLYVHLGEFGIGSGGAMATRFEIVPFAGVIRIFAETPSEIHGQLIIVFGSILIPFVIVPTIWALWRCWRDWRIHRWTVYNYLLLVNAVVMPFVPFSTYREPLGILRFIVGLQIAVILYAAEHRHKRALRNSVAWVVTILFAFSLIQ